jgi:hypothetical protein
MFTLALHVALCLAHVCRLDLVATVALSTELQPSIQVTPAGGYCQAGQRPPWSPGDRESPGGTTDGSVATGPGDHRGKGPTQYGGWGDQGLGNRGP